jgi:hypothetical protein
MRFAQADFKREARWLLLLAVVVPTIGMLLAVVLPALSPSLKLPRGKFRCAGDPDQPDQPDLP